MPSSARPRGAAWEATRRSTLTRDGWTCVRCGHHDPTGETLECDHVEALANGGGSQSWNLATLCVDCHRAKSAAEAGARRRSTKNGSRSKTQSNEQDRVFPAQEGTPSPVSSSLSPAPTEPTDSPVIPIRLGREPAHLAEVLATLRAYSLPEPDPETDTLPRVTSGQHPRAVGTYGPECVAHAESRGVRLRWWQKFSAYRALEHDADGRLVWETVLVTCTRQSGKSWLLRELAFWRMKYAPAMYANAAEVVVMVSDRLDAGREVWLPAASWADEHGWKVRRTNGEQEIASPAGARWLVRSSRSGGYGFTVSMPIVDECWNVDPSTIEDALAPTMVECDSPQMIVTSTAHPRATATFPALRRRALEQLHEPDATLILEWSANPARSSDDEDGWREASPYWNARRRAFIAERWAKSYAEESFRTQWLNVWPSLSRAALVTEDEWVEIATVGLKPPEGAPLVVAAEIAKDGSSYSAVAAWESEPGRYSAVVASHRSWLPVATCAREWSNRPGSRFLLSVGLLNPPRIDPQTWPCEVVPVGTRESRGAVSVLKMLIEEGRLTHDGNGVLAKQIAHALVVDTEYGPHVSGGRSPLAVDGVKALLWAVATCATQEIAVPRIA